MRLIPYDALADRGIPYSKIQIWRLERDGRFPRRVSVGPQRYAWIETEIDQYIAERVRLRDEVA
jgi:prophage regulatory protein